MATALTTIDVLAASIQQSFVAANELILESSKSTSNPPSAEPADVLDQQAQFIVNNNLDRPSAAIPLALFQSPVRYYLSALHVDLPCYMISGPRFFKRQQLAIATMLHSFTPTLWHRLFYYCHLYHLSIEVDLSQTRVCFLSASAEEAAQAARQIMRSPTLAEWEFRLTPKQEQQLQALPKIVAKPICWPSFLVRFRCWLVGKLTQAKRDI